MIPQTRDGAQRLGLVTLEQMTSALLAAVENPAEGTCVLTVPQIHAAKALKAAPDAAPPNLAEGEAALIPK